MDSSIINSGSGNDEAKKMNHMSSVSVSETEILRKAYELILDNSDMFFNELGKAFQKEQERKDIDLI